MLKKRLIFTLLWDKNSFMLSRNFRLQRVGDLKWLQKNYNFSKISFSIDELIVLDVSRGERNFDVFCQTLKELTTGCFMPIAAGGGIRTIDQARQLLRSGADKVVMNTVLYQDADLMCKLAAEFGQQCLVGAVDYKRTKEGAEVYSANGENREGELAETLQIISRLPIGELYLNSMDRDGTGQGYDLEVLKLLPKDLSIPVIIAGGAGNFKHLFSGLAEERVDAVATAHLFNFVGDGLSNTRSALLDQGCQLAAFTLFSGQ